MSGVDSDNSRLSSASEAVSTSVRKSLAAFAVRVWRSSRRARNSATASSTAACAAASSRSTARTLTGDRDEHGGLGPRGVQGAQRHALQVEQVAAAEHAARARDPAQLDLARADEHERVAPLGLVVGAVVAGAHRDDPHGHSVSGRPNAGYSEPGKVTISVIAPTATVSTSRASASKVSERGLRR